MRTEAVRVTRAHLLAILISNQTKILPCVLIAIDIAAGLVCLANGDMRKFIYWEAAAVLSSAVTF